MLYLGGKAHVAARLRRAMEPYLREHGHVVWEPFCGGLNVSRELTDCTGLLSDAHPALIALYTSYRAGWRPPATVTRADWERARDLPDHDPLKAFAGFGCSRLGDYFSGYHNPGSRQKLSGPQAGTWSHDNPARAAAEGLSVLKRLTGFSIARHDFLAVVPCAMACLIYCDPPYAGTTGYSGVSAFNHQRFWHRCQEWAAHTTVLVSEQSCPVPHTVVWQYDKLRNLDQVRPGAVGRRVREYLYKVQP